MSADLVQRDGRGEFPGFAELSETHNVDVVLFKVSMASRYRTPGEISREAARGRVRSNSRPRRPRSRALPRGENAVGP